MVSENLVKVVEELKVWMPSETEEFQSFIYKALASLPGGENIEDIGYEPHGFLGWKEIDLIGKLFQHLNDSGDVRFVADQLAKEE